MPLVTTVCSMTTRCKAVWNMSVRSGRDPVTLNTVIRLLQWVSSCECRRSYLTRDIMSRDRQQKWKRTEWKRDHQRTSGSRWQYQTVSSQSWVAVTSDLKVCNRRRHSHLQWEVNSVFWHSLLSLRYYLPHREWARRAVRHAGLKDLRRQSLLKSNILFHSH